MYDDLDGLK